MSADEKTTAVPQESSTTTSDVVDAPPASENLSSEAMVEQERSEKILKAKEMYSHGSRNFLVKSYAEAADDLSQVCALYEELHGELSDELGMPYLLYGKSLIALALDENKVIDVPDEEEDDDDDEEEEDEETEAVSTNGGEITTSNGSKLEVIKEDGVDSTEVVESEDDKKESAKSEVKPMETDVKTTEEAQVSSTEDAGALKEEAATKSLNGTKTNGCSSNGSSISVVNDGEKPSTSNGEDAGEDAAAEDEENEAASNLQLAWEILELAAKIFTRQGERGRANLAEVQTELGNIEFENNLLEAARSDYEKALSLYEKLTSNYRRAMAEIHYKIGLAYLMQQLNTEGAASLKEACKLIADEIEEMKSKPDPTEKDKNNIQDMEETKQEIEAKIVEIEETQAQNVAEVRAALDSYIKPLTSSGDADAGTSKSVVASVDLSPAKGSVSTSAITSSSKPTDITHLIKRKKPEDASSEAEAAACSPAKRPAV